jgi:hypothetical protein
MNEAELFDLIRSLDSSLVMIANRIEDIACELHALNHHMRGAECTAPEQHEHRCRLNNYEPLGDGQ